MRTSNLITTLVLSVFGILGITGILLFVDIDSDMLEDIHAYLGISFVVLGLYHLINNFSILKNYLKKNKSLVYTMSSLFILGFMLVSFALIFGEDEEHDRDRDKDRDHYELKDGVEYEGRRKFERYKRDDDDDDDDDDKKKD